MRGFGLDTTGRLIEPGQTRHVREHSFAWGEAAPSWIETPAGTPTVLAHTTSSRGMLRVLSDGTSGASATIQTIAFPTRWYRAVMFEARGLQIANDAAGAGNATFEMSFSNGSGFGPVFTQSSGQADGVVTLDGTTHETRFDCGLGVASTANRWRNMGMIFYPLLGELVMFESLPEGPVVAVQSASPADPTAVTARFKMSMTANHAAVKGLRVCGMRLTAWLD